MSVSLRPLNDLHHYAAVARHGVHAPAQHPLWVEEWIANLSPDGLIAIVEHNGEPGCALALEIVRSGPFQLARFLGGNHANGNFPASSRSLLESGTFHLGAILSAIRGAYPQVDALVFERLVPEWGGFANPLLAHPHTASPNLALAVDLAGGFEAVLGRVNGKRKRKKHRSQLRRYEAAGGFHRIEARTPEEVDRLLDAFFEMKKARFRTMGIANVFGDVEIQNFFRSLFRDALLEPHPPFVLHALEVGGKLRDVTGSSVSGNRIVCDFAAIAEDELSSTSPGEFLFFQNLEAACQEGLEIYDFGVGDEAYKRQWCDIETRQFDIVIPLSFKGRAFAYALRLKTAIKAYVKNSPGLWNVVKRLRRSASGQQGADPG